MAFPAGVFLVALFIVSAFEDQLDFRTPGNIFLGILTFLLFLLPPVIVLFVHPTAKGINGVAGTIANSKNQSNRRLRDGIILIALAVITLIPFLFLLTFIVGIFGSL